ncbi:MAG: N,N-dimethylformamidase [Gammaproteobacteria bacterium]|nr:N,N-dimethylformamidase [Gammaproteobacteria bacterium]
MKKILGYADNWSVTPGERVGFKVSTYGAERYRADLVRVVCGDDHPDHDILRLDPVEAPFAGEYPGRMQPIDAGSCAVVPSADAFDALDDFTLLAWVYPTTPAKGPQVLMAQWRDDPAAGFMLLLDERGALALRLGDGEGGIAEVSTGEALAERRWYLVAGSYDAATKTLSVSQQPLGDSLDPLSDARASAAAGGFAVARTDFCFAALAAAAADGRPVPSCCFNGKIDRPRLVAGVLDDAGIAAVAAAADSRQQPCALVAAWDFARDTGTDVISDIGPNALHGRTLNLPSRGCKGFNWSGTEQSWRHAPDEYGAIHFHDDDLYDAGWDTDFEYHVPADLKSGVYAARLRVDGDESYVTFFVRPPPGKTTAKLAFLASTVTYIAYSNYQWLFHERYAEVTETFWTTLQKSDVFLQEHPEFGLSTYDYHADGSGVRYASRLRPILNMAPTTPCWSFNADTHILGWLEARGIDYDVITDEDLHCEGAGLLERYRAVLTGTHPEYYTTPMMDALRTYLAGAGRLAYLGGNGFIWRCAMSDSFPGAVELRRAEDGIRYRDEEPGEYYLEFTGEYGGLWRRLGLPPQAVVGVGTVAVGFDESGYYRRTADSFDPRAAFIFDGIGKDEIIGDFGYLGDGASGSEIDAVDPLLGTPAHALVVASSEGHSANTLIVPDEIGFHHVAMDGVQSPRVRADMTFFETPGGGAVFSVGSIAWGASLPHNGYDNNVARISSNVIARFLEDEGFEGP